MQMLINVEKVLRLFPNYSEYNTLYFEIIYKEKRFKASLISLVHHEVINQTLQASISMFNVKDYEDNKNKQYVDDPFC